MTIGNPFKSHALLYVVIGVVSVALLLLAIVLDLALIPALEDGIWKGTLWFFTPFIKELGFAGLISIIIIYTVEYRSREQYASAATDLMHEVNTNLLRSVYKRYIPESVFNEVEQCLLTCDFFRTDYKIDYTLEDISREKDEQIDPGTDHLKCTASTSYTIVNTSPVEQTYKLNLLLERPLNGDWLGECKVLSVEIGHVDLSEEDISAHTKVTDEHIAFSYSIQVPPGKEGIPIATAATLIKQTTDMEVWTFLVPSNRVELLISTPGKNLEVLAHANHSQELIPSSGVHNSATKRWELPYGIFPYQSIVWWWKRDPD